MQSSKNMFRVLSSYRISKEMGNNERAPRIHQLDVQVGDVLWPCTCFVDTFSSCLSDVSSWSDSGSLSLAGGMLHCFRCIQSDRRVSFHLVTDDTHFDHVDKGPSDRFRPWKVALFPFIIYQDLEEVLWNHVNIWFFIKLAIYSSIALPHYDTQFIPWVAICHCPSLSPSLLTWTCTLSQTWPIGARVSWRALIILWAGRCSWAQDIPRSPYTAHAPASEAAASARSPDFLLMEKVVRSREVGASCAHCCWGAAACQASQVQS